MVLAVRIGPALVPSTAPSHPGDHPAAIAWRKVAGNGVKPTRVQVLKESAKSCVYRLEDALSPRRAVIVHRRRRESLEWAACSSSYLASAGAEWARDLRYL